MQNVVKCQLSASATLHLQAGQDHLSLLVLPYHTVQSLHVYNDTKLKLRGGNQAVKHMRQGNLVTGKKMSVLTVDQIDQEALSNFYPCSL